MTTRPDLEPIIRQAMAHLPWDTAEAIIKTQHLFAPVADEDHANDSVVRADVSRALASVGDQMGFELDEGLQTHWDRVALDLGKQLGKELVADLFEIPQVVLLVED